MADFQFYLNRQGPRGPQGFKGDKGDDGQTPVPRTGTNTPIETTVIFDTGDGNPYETPNLKYPIEDRGGNMVMLDRSNDIQYYGDPDQATDNSYGVVKLATTESILVDPLDSDVVTYELFDSNNQAIKTITDRLDGDITQLNTDLGIEVTNRTNADIQLTNKIHNDISNEATTRSNADIALGNRIDSLNTSKANKSEVYTKTQTDSLLNNKSNVGHTHSYNEVTNKPTIGNGTITITQGGVTKGTFTTNQTGNSTIELDQGGGGGTSFTAGTGLELTNQDILNVKIDGNTITTNTSGELVANGGTTYIAGNGIDLINDEITVKVDGSTIDFDSSGNLTATTYTLPTASTSTLGGVKVDGNTITIDNNGVISAASSTPSNMVTTNTSQDITASKRFFGSSSRLRFQSREGTNYNRTYSQLDTDSLNFNYESYPNTYTTQYNQTGITLTNSWNHQTRLLNQPYGQSYNYAILDTSCNEFRLGSDNNAAAYILKQPWDASGIYSNVVNTNMLDGTTLTYDNATHKISAVNNSIAKTAPVIPLKYEETEDGVSVGIGGTLNHTNYISSTDNVYVYDASVAAINNMSGDGYFTQTAKNMMSKIFYKGYKIRLDNGLNIAWNVASASGFFMNVAVGYYNSGTFVPVLYALNTQSYGGSMFARTAMEFGSDIYDMGRLYTQYTGCVGVSLLGDTLSAFSPSNGRHTYTISNPLLTEFQKCTHAICTVIMESGNGYSFDYSTAKFVNPTDTLSAVLEDRDAVFNTAENLILNTDITVVPELKLNYDSTYFKVVNNQLTLDIQAIKNAIDALT